MEETDIHLSRAPAHHDFPQGRRQPWDGHKAKGRQQCIFMWDPGLPASAPSPMVPWVPFSSGRGERHRKPWTSCPSYPPSGFRWLRPHIVLSWDRSLAGDIRDLSPTGRPPGTLLWTQSHIERPPIPAHLPPCLPNPGQAPNPSTVCSLFITRLPL